MFNFIAFVWQKSCSQDSNLVELFFEQLHKKSQIWQQSYRTKGMLVLHRAHSSNIEKCYVVHDPDKPNQGGGVILGKIFPRSYIETYQIGDCAPSDPIFDNKENSRIIDTGGKHLTTHYWGRYVTFLENKSNHTYYVLPDPSGTLPCYYTQHKGVGIYFTNIEDCAQLDGIRFSIDWKHISNYLCINFTQKNDTGLKEVSRLLAGECSITRHLTTTRVCYWNPIDLSQTNIIEDPIVASNEIRRTTIGCVKAWSSCFDNYVLRLSGGLDSSILLGCLKRAEALENTTLVNYYSGKTSDERRYARIAAQHSNLKLHEKNMQSLRVDFRYPSTQPITALPGEYCSQESISAYEAQLVPDNNMAALMVGQGGDEVFFNNKNNYSAIDYAYHHGIDLKLFHTSLEAARISDTSIWSVLHAVVREKFSKHPTDPFERYNTLLDPNTAINPDYRESMKFNDILHPILDNVVGIPPGKYLHIYYLCQSYVQYRSSVLQPVNPLLSQPLVELSLRIPTYVHTIGGRTRGIARMAFANDVPLEIISRQSKGSGSDHYETIFKENLEFIREQVLDGILVEKNIIDREKLLQTFNQGGNDPTFVADITSMEMLVWLETWLRKWTSAPYCARK